MQSFYCNMVNTRLQTRINECNLATFPFVSSWVSSTDVQYSTHAEVIDLADVRLTSKPRSGFDLLTRLREGSFIAFY